MRLTRILLLLLLSLCGCATVDVRRLDRDDSTSDGIRFYRAEPYLLVDADRKVSIIYLPDKSAEYAITQGGGLGGKSLEVTLGDGWYLSKLGAEAGAQPDKAIDLLAKAVPAAAAARAEDFAPGLYRFVWDDKTGQHVTALERIGP